ncbi:hypothetical protein F2Q69_00035652 [Brassica cretica]|uniref:Uncharacterized protein n=1 Tax=Brassica cretica TaxID=69181 RepID=A0A8S9SKG0_BRACR|nr:hypothetical protein F2Q69_00035652 [Brassica cretica]
MFVTFPFSQSSDIRHACRPTTTTTTTTTVLPLSSSICKASSGRCAGGVAESRPGMVAGVQGVHDPSSDVRDPRATPAPDLFLVRDIIRQLASDDQGVPDQATKDVCDPIEATRSIPARIPFVSSSRLNSFGGPIQQSSKVER